MTSNVVRAMQSAFVILAATGSLVYASPDENNAPEAMARVFLEAEAKNWVKTWLDAHPPGTSITALGGKALFAVELIMAADRYNRADSDKERFHAVLRDAFYLGIGASRSPHARVSGKAMATRENWENVGQMGKHAKIRPCT